MQSVAIAVILLAGATMEGAAGDQGMARPGHADCAPYFMLMSHPAPRPGRPAATIGDGRPAVARRPLRAPLPQPQRRPSCFRLASG